MIFMLPMDGALRANIHLASEAVVRYFLLAMFFAKVGNFLIVGRLGLFFLSGRTI